MTNASGGNKPRIYRLFALVDVQPARPWATEDWRGICALVAKAAIRLHRQLYEDTPLPSAHTDTGIAGPTSKKWQQPPPLSEVATARLTPGLFAICRELSFRYKINGLTSLQLSCQFWWEQIIVPVARDLLAYTWMEWRFNPEKAGRIGWHDHGASTGSRSRTVWPPDYGISLRHATADEARADRTPYEPLSAPKQGIRKTGPIGLMRLSPHLVLLSQGPGLALTETVAC